jgi:hypothetical protein
VELHALAQFEGVGLAVRADVDRFGQQRPDLGVLAIGDQAFDDVQHHRIAVAVPVHAGLGRPDVGRQRNAQRRGGLRPCGAGQAAQRQRNRGAQ